MGGQKAQEDDYAYIWKILHAVFALTLGIYICFTSSNALSAPLTATGERMVVPEQIAGERGGSAARLFPVFATAELLLQGTRYFLESSGRIGPKMQPGLFGVVAGFLPPPWNGYVKLVGRYRGIWGTVVEDGAVVIFVIGLVSWWCGAAR